MTAIQLKPPHFPFYGLTHQLFRFTTEKVSDFHKFFGLKKKKYEKNISFYKNFIKTIVKITGFVITY